VVLKILKVSPQSLNLIKARLKLLFIGASFLRKLQLLQFLVQISHSFSNLLTVIFATVNPIPDQCEFLRRRELI